MREIDEKETCKNVRKLLKKDLKRLQFMAGVKLVNLSSPTLDQAGGSHTNTGNHNEDKVINGIDVSIEIDAIVKTVQGIPEPYRTVLVDRYFTEKGYRERISRSRYEQNVYYKRLHAAEIAFADLFEYWQRKLHCSKIIDLHVYKD
nr:ArpU family phage packaging/lysis transcriptional regulator [Lactobacillus colini]